MATDKIGIRVDTAANWTSNNPVLEAGEQGHESDTGRRKIGDGSTAWNSLDYIDEATRSYNLAFADGYGIDFSATEGGGASSSVLDDYEEGTWTPTMGDGTATTGGEYTKIGRYVLLRGYVVNTTGYSDGTAIIEIGGLPFTFENYGGVTEVQNQNIGQVAFRFMNGVGNHAWCFFASATTINVAKAVDLDNGEQITYGDLGTLSRRMSFQIWGEV